VAARLGKTNAFDPVDLAFVSRGEVKRERIF
jgi:hypothetical protein